MSCPVLASGAIELHFYGELAAAEYAEVGRHLSACDECRQALEDLRTIRAALGERADVAAPPGGDWSGFMARLDASLGREGAGAVVQGRRSAPRSPARRLAPYLAAAAVLTLVTLTAVTALLVLRQGDGARRQPPPSAEAVDVAAGVPQLLGPDVVLSAVSDQHFERSKLVVLGLATKDGRQDDWSYERNLAGGLLEDTRLYRLAAEEQGMQSLAGVMRDLELLLLQASMSSEADAASLDQLQRLIRRRDLVAKMDVVHAGGS